MTLDDIPIAQQVEAGGMAFPAQEPAGGPVDAVVQFRKTQHGRPVGYGKQLQENPRVPEERSRPLRFRPSFVTHPRERRPPSERSHRRPDRTPAVEHGVPWGEFFHQALVHIRSHLLEWDDRHAVCDVDPFLQGQLPKEHRIRLPGRRVRRSTLRPRPGRETRSVRSPPPRNTRRPAHRHAPSVPQPGPSRRSSHRCLGSASRNRLCR